MNENEILDACLDALRQGATLANCMEQYPELSEESLVILRAASRLQAAGGELTPDPVFKRRARGNLMQRIAAEQSQTAGAPPVVATSSGLGDRVREWWQAFLAGLSGPGMKRYQPIAAILALILVIALSAGVVTAAQNAQPGDFLYPVRRLTDQVRATLNPEDEAPALEATPTATFTPTPFPLTLTPEVTPTSLIVPERPNASPQPTAMPTMPSPLPSPLPASPTPQQPTATTMPPTATVMPTMPPHPSATPMPGPTMTPPIAPTHQPPSPTMPAATPTHQPPSPTMPAASPTHAPATATPLPPTPTLMPPTATSAPTAAPPLPTATMAPPSPPSPRP